MDGIPRYRFGEFVLDLERGVLLAAGVELPLRPKSFALLRHFVENHGRLIGRDEIIGALWPNVFVTDDSIVQCVRDVRRALNDENGTILRTQPRRGYLFTAEVWRDEAPAPADAPPLPDRPSIAVLPFQNMSGDPDQEYFADGTVEEITTALSRIRWLFVIARNSAFTYKGRPTDIKQVGRELGVRYVLEGSVRKSGERVRVTAQLIDTANGAHIWVDRYDRELRDIFAVQDDIASSVAAIMEPTLAEAEQHRVLRKPPERMDAWEACQRGLWHFHKFGADENAVAQTFFRQSMRLDPSFAPAHYGLALAEFWDFWLYSRRPLSDLHTSSLDAARRAVVLDDKDAMAHAVLAEMTLAVGETKTAIAEARAAVALNPNNATVVGILGLTAGFGGHHAEAIEHLRQAMRASPRDPLTWAWKFWEGMTRFFARDFAGSVTCCQEVMRLRPDYSHPLIYIAAARAHLGWVDAARAAMDDFRARFPGEIERQFGDRPVWLRPEDWELRMEGLRLIDGA